MARSRPDSVISSYGSRRVLAPSVFLNLAQVVSFTQGSGPEGFIELSPDRSDIVRARVDAVNLLPYLGGSGLRIPSANACLDSGNCWRTFRADPTTWRLVFHGEDLGLQSVGADTISGARVRPRFMHKD